MKQLKLWASVAICFLALLPVYVVIHFFAAVFTIITAPYTVALQAYADMKPKEEVAPNRRFYVVLPEDAEELELDLDPKPDRKDVN